MGVFLVEVEERRDAERATQHGAAAAFVFSAMLGFSLWLVAEAGGLPGTALLDQSGQNIVLAILGGQLAIALGASVRFFLGKGLVIGGIAFAMFLIEMLFKLTSGFVGIFWYLIYFAMLLGFVNGLRGAYELRKWPEELPADVAHAFE